MSQFGTFFHPYRTYLYSDVFDATPKDQPKTIGDICKEIYAKHPQIGQDVIYDAVTRMADAGMIKWVKKVERNPLHHQLQQYKYDVEGEWKEYPRDYLHQFAHECGKKITLSEDELKAEFFRDHKDYEDLFCQGHLARADRAKLRQ